MVEEIKKELDELKVEAYDMESAFAKYKEEMSRKISELSDKISNLKENDKVEENVATESNPVVEGEVQQDALESVPVSDPTPVIATEEETTPVVENNEVSNDTQVVTQDSPVQEVPTEAVVEGLPLIQPAETSVVADIPSAPALDQTPLSPKVEGIPSIQETPQEEIKEESSNKKVFIKTDSMDTKPKAILLSNAQSSNARKSKEVQDNMLFNANEITSPVVEIPTGEQPVVEQPAVVTELNSNTDLESMMQNLQAKQQEAIAAGDMKKAEDIGNEMMLVKKSENRVS